MFARTLLQPRDRPRPGRPLSMKQRRPSQTLSALRWPTSAALETLRRVAMAAAGERTTLCCSHSRSLSCFVQLYPAYPCSPDWVDSCLSSKTPFLPNFLRSLHPPPLRPLLSLPSPLPPRPSLPPKPYPFIPHILDTMGLISPPCCAIFSVFGGVFLACMGFILSSSTHIYIKGIHDAAAASENCYYAAACYAGTFGISVFLLAKARAGAPADYGDGEIETRNLLLRNPPTNYGT